MTDRSLPPLDHYVSREPFDPYVVEKMTAEQERFFMASQWTMMWWKFRRHRLAVISGVILGVLCASILISEFLAPYELSTRHGGHIFAPPQSLHLFHDGEFVGPFVYGYDFKLNRQNLKREYTVNTSKVQRLRFFCSGDEYKFWGTLE
ncbi:MAG: ABC transporter permease, partial [Alphaproteobacteria bacterium]|nr:ABC transporter permease [Alphaproteobacteria bacterium]